MLHPVAPFITENFYQDIAQERVLDQKIDLIAFKEEQKEL
jgi:valyl-tRNA synthetase